MRFGFVGVLRRKGKHLLKSIIHMLKKVRTITLFLGLSSVAVIASSILFFSDQSPKAVYGVASIGIFFLVIGVASLMLFLHRAFMHETSLGIKNELAFRSLNATIVDLQNQQARLLKESSTSSSIAIQKMANQIDLLEKSIGVLGEVIARNEVESNSATQKSTELIEELARTNALKHSAVRSNVEKLEEQTRTSIDELKKMFESSEFRSSLMMNEMYRSLKLPETLNVPKEIRGAAD